MFDQSVINLLIQIPLAGIIVFLTIRFLDHLKELNKSMLEFISKESETNRAFLKTQREQMNESVGRLAEEIKTLRIELAKRDGKERQ